MKWNDNGIAVFLSVLCPDCNTLVFVDCVVRNHGGCACGEFAL